MSERRFRIMDGRPSVPWRLVEPFEAQALANHAQTLERLNARGGLDVRELWCVVHGKRQRELPTIFAADAWLKQWLADDERAQDQATIATLKAALLEACALAGAGYAGDYGGESFVEWPNNARARIAELRRARAGHMITLWHAFIATSPLVAIGHRCVQELNIGIQCCEVATHEQAWPGSDYRPICDRHLATALRLSNVFGFVLPVRPLFVWRRPEGDDTEQRFRMMELN